MIGVFVDVLLGDVNILLQNGAGEHEAVGLRELLEIVIDETVLVALLLGDGEAFWEERIHVFFDPPLQVFEARAQAHFGGEQGIVLEVVHQLEVVQRVRLERRGEPSIVFIIVHVVVMGALVLIRLENAVPLDREFEMEHRRVHVRVFVPPSIKQRLLEACIALANENFRLLVQAVLLFEQGPLQSLLNVKCAVTDSNIL